MSNPRRKRLARRTRDAIVGLTVSLMVDCDECFANSYACRAHGDDAYHCDNDCANCKNWEPMCNHSSTCPGSMDAVCMIRDAFKGRPDRVRKGFAEKVWCSKCQSTTGFMYDVDSGHNIALACGC